MIRALWPLALLSLLTAGCSTDTVDDTDVNEDKLHGKYQVHYHAGDRTLQHYAQLRIGGPTGTTIRLTAGDMAVDGQSMQVIDGDQNPINLAGTYYFLRSSTEMPAEKYVFTWTRSDGSTYENEVATVEPFTVSAPAEGATITDGDLVVTIEGPQLAAGEHYVAWVDAESRAGENETGLLSESVNSGSVIIFPAAEVADLPAGNLVIKVRKTRSTAPQTGHADEGGELISTWNAPDITVVRAAPTE